MKLYLSLLPIYTKSNYEDEITVLVKELTK